MNKPKFKIYSKVKDNTMPFNDINQKVFNINAIKKQKAITSEQVSYNNSPIFRKTTPLNKVSSSPQKYHPNILPLIRKKSPNCYFSTLERSKTPNQTENYKSKKELQIILSLKNQIKAQNEVIMRNAEEIEELKKMKRVSYVNEIKAENQILLSEIQNMKKLFEGIDTTASQAIEGIEGIDCLTPVEIHQKRIIKSLKDANLKLSTEMFKLSQDKNTCDFLLEKIEHYEKKIKSLKEINDGLTDKLVKKESMSKSTYEHTEPVAIANQFETKENEISVDKLASEKGSNVPIPKLLSNEEKNDIEYLFRQCLYVRNLSWVGISQEMKEQQDFGGIENVITQSLALCDNDKLVIRRYLVDLSIDDNGNISIELLLIRLNEKLNSELEDNGSHRNLNLDLEDNKLNEIGQKCRKIDINNQSTISFKLFRELYNSLYNKEGIDTLTINEFNSMVRAMKKNNNLSFEQLDYQCLKSNSDSHDHDNNDNTHNEQDNTSALNNNNTKSLSFREEPKLPSLDKKGKPNNHSAEYNQARAIVTNIFDFALQQVYIIESNQKEEKEAKINEFIDEILFNATEMFICSLPESSIQIANGVSDTDTPII